MVNLYWFKWGTHIINRLIKNYEAYIIFPNNTYLSFIFIIRSHYTKDGQWYSGFSFLPIIPVH